MRRCFHCITGVCKPNSVPALLYPKGREIAIYLGPRLLEGSSGTNWITGGWKLETGKFKTNLQRPDSSLQRSRVRPCTRRGLPFRRIAPLETALASCKGRIRKLFTFCRPQMRAARIVSVALSLPAMLPSGRWALPIACTLDYWKLGAGKFKTNLQPSSNPASSSPE